MGYSPWGHKGSDTTERLSLFAILNSSTINIFKEKFSLFFKHFFLDDKFLRKWVKKVSILDYY